MRVEDIKALFIIKIDSMNKGKVGIYTINEIYINVFGYEKCVFDLAKVAAAICFQKKGPTTIIVKCDDFFECHIPF